MIVCLEFTKMVFLVNGIDLDFILLEVCARTIIIGESIVRIDVLSSFEFNVELVIEDLDIGDVVICLVLKNVNVLRV